MAHFAELDENNIVLRVVVVADEHEADGENWCADFFGGGNWKQTSYNANIRYNYAGVEFTYDPVADAFYAPQPFPSGRLPSRILPMVRIMFGTKNSLRGLRNNARGGHHHRSVPARNAGLCPAKRRVRA